MSKRRVLVLCSVIGAVAVGVVWSALAPREPVYQGKRLRRWLDDFNGPSLRQENLAKDAIRQMGAKALPWVIDYLRRGNSRFRQWAAKELDAPSVSGYERKGLKAVEALGPAAKQAIPEVERALLDGDDDLRPLAASALVAIGPDALDVLHRALQHPNARIRGLATWWIGDFGMAATSSVPVLVSRLQDLDPVMRADAAHSLGTIRANPETVVPALAMHLSETNELAFANVIKALESFGAQATAAVPALERELRAGKPSRRATVALTLLKVDPRAAENAGLATAEILKTLRTGDETSRLTAGCILLWLEAEPKILVPGLVPALSDTNATVRQLAILTLGRHGQTAQGVLSNVVACLHDPDEGVRYAATSAVVRIAPSFSGRSTN